MLETLEGNTEYTRNVSTPLMSKCYRQSFEVYLTLIWNLLSVISARTFISTGVDFCNLDLKWYVKNGRIDVTILLRLRQTVTMKSQPWLDICPISLFISPSWMRFLIRPYIPTTIRNLWLYICGIPTLLNDSNSLPRSLMINSNIIVRIIMINIIVQIIMINNSYISLLYLYLRSRRPVYFI